jgi:hypothetical protein
MKMITSTGGIALATLLLAAAPAHAQQLFKCVTAQGKTVYQDQPCEEKAKQSTVRGSQAPVTAPPAEEAKQEKEDPNAPDRPVAELTRAAIEVVVGYAMCSEKVEGFSGKNSQAYEAWKRRNEGEMKKMNNRAEARILNERLRIERTRTEPFEERCEAFGAQLATSGPPKAAAQ